MKSLIKKFQINDKIVKKFVEKNKKSSYRRRNKFYWKINSKKFFKFKNRFYVFENATIKKKFINKHYDDFLTKHFNVHKIVNLIQRKFYWFVCAKQIRFYVKICDICQRIKIHRHKFFEKFKFLSISNIFWKKIIMNFIIDLFFNKRRDVIYDSILMIMNRYIKMIKYIFVTIKIDVVTLTKIFYEKILFRFDTSTKIINDKNFVFINAFWFSICYYARIKRRLNIVFYFQTNDLIERQNQIFETYLRIFVDAKQTKWTNMLFMIEFVYNNVTHFFTNVSFYYFMYDYYSKIHYVIENDFIEKKIFFAKNKIKHLHDVEKMLIKRLKHVVAKQTKYYNQKHIFKKFNVDDLIIFNIKNFKQRRFNKKMSHKYVKSFKIKNKIDAQTYRLILFNIYRINNVFHVSLLKNYYYKKNDKHAKQFMQISKLINDKKQWKIEKFFDKIDDRKNIWYKIKWFNWNFEYNQWLHKKEFKNVSKLMKKYNERTSRKRKRRH